MIKLLIGGSPCTKWSIAQKKDREVTASGEGWELFLNYKIAKEKFKPDFFLYENNKSAAQPIKDQIAHELGVGKDPKVRFTYINSSLVSAQNRQRFYVTNFGDIEQPEDRGILLGDILESDAPFGANDSEKGYCLDANYHKGSLPENTLVRRKRTQVAEPLAFSMTGTFGNRNASVSEKAYCLAANPSSDMSARSIEPVRVGCYPSPDGALPINTTADDKAQCVRASCYKDGIRNLVGNDVDKRTCVAIPVEFVGEVPVKAVSCADGKEYPVYQVLNGQITIRDKQYDIKLPDGYYIIRKLTVTECCRLQTMPDDYFDISATKLKEVILWSQNAPSQIVKIPFIVEKQDFATSIINDFCGMELLNDKEKWIEAKNAKLKGAVEIKKQLWDSVLCIIKDTKEQELQNCLNLLKTDSNKNILRLMMNTDLNIEKLQKKLSADHLNKMRLSTILILTKEIMTQKILKLLLHRNIRPSIETFTVSCGEESRICLGLELLNTKTKNMRLISDTACLKGLGNGWTAEVIIHLLNHALKDIPRDEEIVVLSMYDGIGTGRYCLDKMGFTNIKYHAYEIDKYAMQIAQSNFADIIQHGDAFQVREENWSL